MTTRSVDSPIGRIVLAGDGSRLQGLYMTEHKRAPVLDAVDRDDGAFIEAVRQLTEWFEGRRTTFDLDLDPVGTQFQTEVWAALVSIPFGTTTTYGDLATKLGRPGSARAVGHAVARNPIGIVVPCHRVVGANGVLTGFAAGLDRKRWLLEHERSAGLIP
jgi:methylated-DNA-[protein]-cysteine S-methyltransferase